MLSVKIAGLGLLEILPPIRTARILSKEVKGHMFKILEFNQRFVIIQRVCIRKLAGFR